MADSKKQLDDLEIGGVKFKDLDEMIEKEQEDLKKSLYEGSPAG